MDRVLAIYNELKNKNICQNKGLANNSKDKQLLYGDILDYLRDYYSFLSPLEKDVLAKLIIGDFVVKNCLL